MLTSKDLLEEFNEELPGTRKMLERVPFEKLDFQPSPKSMKLKDLAQLVGTMPYWFTSIVTDRAVDMSTYKQPPAPKNVKELLQTFDQGVKAAQDALSGMNEKSLKEPWALRMGAQVLMELPRGTVLRQTINHLVHHRAQLGVYLKMQGIPHPAVYGASGDEK